MNNKSSDTRNLLVTLTLSMLIIMFWQYYVEAPQRKAQMLAQQARANAQVQIKHEQEKEEAQLPQTREQWLAQSPRVLINSSNLHGSVALKGLRFDDLTLARYHEALNPNSPEVVLFSPAGMVGGYFAAFGWTSDDVALKLPGDDTLWSADGKELTPEHPVTFSWKNPDGVVFRARVALDDKYMFTVAQSVEAKSPLTLHSYGYINRVFDTKTYPGTGIMHEGPLGVFDGTLNETAYKKLAGGSEQTFDTPSGGWLGISDKYWLAAIIPPNEPFNSHFSYYTSKGRDHFQTDYLSQPQTQSTIHFFAGAKELAVLDAYAAQYQIPLFDRAVDFGMFYFLTKPIFLTLNYFHKLVGNFGIAILLLTVIIKLIMFPLAHTSFRSMHQMKTLQPKINDIRERTKDDKIKMNQEIMELYKREKINPASGCLPIFIQIPVFFALYKVLYVTIEMRHAPFYGWIHDLSAADPTNLFTLFGLINWSPPSFLHLGVWPLVMCATMVIQQHQSPPPPDPAQAKMMKMLPFIFLFVFSSMPAGLVIYWCWSNTFTILQQWYIMTAHKKSQAQK